MNLHLSDREKQALTAALESFRSRKQGVIETTALHDKKSHFYKEVRQPENQYDILSAEHSLMYAITVLARLTSLPIAYFINPNPSQIPPPKTHD